MTWTPELDQMLRNLAKQGLSRREIGDRLGKTKGQVTGRLWRIRAPERAKTIKPRKRTKKKENACTGLKSPKKHEYGFTFEEAIKLKGCLFGLHVGFCGYKREGHHAFCDEHQKKVYVESKKLIDTDN